MQLEAVAWSLLEQHCSILYGRLLWTPGYCDDAVSTIHPRPLVVQVDVDADFPGDTALGARLRLALEVINACCACLELFPARNQRFWRRTMAELWAERWEGQPYDPLEGVFDFPLFTEHSFAHYALLMDAAPASARVFWQSFFQCDSATDTTLNHSRIVVQQCRNLLRAALELRQQTRHVAATTSTTNQPLERQRPLTITAIVDGQNILRGNSLENSLGCLGSQSEIVHYALLQFANRNLWNRSVELRLIMRHLANSSYPLQVWDTWTMAMLRQNAFRSTVRVERLELELMDDTRSLQHTWSLGISPLGELLRATFLPLDGHHEPSTKSLVLSSGAIAPLVFVGAMLSIVPYATSLEAIECILFALTNPRDRLLRLAWLAFALHHPRRSSRLESLTLKTFRETGLNTSETQYIESILHARVPLRDVVGDVLATRAYVHVTCFALGEMAVVVTPGTPLYCEPGHHTNHEGYYVVTVRQETLDAVAHVLDDGSVGVVYPGYGLLWVAQSAVSTWVHGELRHSGEVLLLPAPVSRVTLQFGRTLTHIAGLELLSWICTGPNGLRSLDLQGVGLPHASLAQIFQSNPGLQSLTLTASSLESLSPLLDAYTSTSCVLASLAFRDVRFNPPNDRSFAPLFDALNQPGHAIVGVLREIEVDLSLLDPLVAESDYQRLVCVLEQPRVQLTRVMMTLQAGGRRQQYAVTTRLLALTGRLLSDPLPPTRDATLSVLLRSLVHASGSTRSRPVYSEGIARLVLAFVGGPGDQSLGWIFK